MATTPYNQSAKIQAVHFNDFVALGAQNFNKIWGTGTGDYGYGQKDIPQVAYGNKFTASATKGGTGTDQSSSDYGGWAALTDGITKLAAHTGATIIGTPVPVLKNKATYLSQIATNLATLHANRLNAASQGSTVYTNVAVPSGDPWKNKVTFNFDVNFGSADKARWFFNAGGQLKVSADHPQGPNINILIRALAQSIGDIWISGVTSGTVNLSGSSWNGITKLGGTDPSLVTTFATNYGYPSWTSTPTTLIKQTTANGSNGYYHGYATNSFIEVLGSTNGSGVVTITVIIDEVPIATRPTPGIGGLIGTNATLIVRPPSSQYLTANWGTPTVTASYSSDNSDN